MMMNVLVTKDDLHLYEHNVNKELFDINGVDYVGREWISFKNIKRGFVDNVARKRGEDRTQIESLIISFSRGIDFRADLPILEVLPSSSVGTDGSVFTHRVVGGNHRIEALTELGYEGYWFDVIKTGVNGVGKLRSQTVAFMRENDNLLPKLNSSEVDIVNAISKVVREGEVENTEDDIRAFVKECCPSLSNYRVGAITALICQETNPSTNFVNWNARSKDDLKKIMRNKFDRASHGEYDHIQHRYGYTFLDGYVLKGAYHALKKYHETGKESYVIGHVKSPDDGGTLINRRLALMNNISDFEDVLVSAFKFYQKNHRLPFRLEGFLPQDAVNELDSINKGEVLTFSKKELESLHKLKSMNKLSNALNTITSFEDEEEDDDMNTSRVA